MVAPYPGAPDPPEPGAAEPPDEEFADVASDELSDGTDEDLPQEAVDGVAALVAVIQRPVVHVHAHELVRQVPAHVAGVLQRVLHGFGTMIEAVLDARG